VLLRGDCIQDNPRKTGGFLVVLVPFRENFDSCAVGSKRRFEKMLSLRKWWPIPHGPVPIGLYVRWRTERPDRKAYGNWCPMKRLSPGFDPLTYPKGNPMNGIVYLVGAIVIILAILSFLGLR